MVMAFFHFGTLFRELDSDYYLWFWQSRSRVVGTEFVGGPLGMSSVLFTEMGYALVPSDRLVHV